MRTVSLNLTENGVLNFQLIDVQAVSFDPIYFSVDNDRVVYIGNTGNCKLIYNEAYQVMFIENSTNRLGGEGDLYINGWGIGWPDLWSNNPDWNFDNAIVLTKHADNKYHFTSAVSKWGTFKFYTDKDWGDEIDLQQMTVTTPILAVEEEDGKPGNYNIYYKPQSDTETIIVRFTYDFDTNTLDASIIKEIN